MTPIQEKIYSAMRTLSSIRELAKLQGAAFRAENKLALARYYENLAHDLSDNTSISQSTLAHHLEGTTEFKSEVIVHSEDVLKSMENVLRYLPAYGVKLPKETS